MSAGSVLAALDRDRYDVVPIGISPEGRWLLAADDPKRLVGASGELPQVDPDGPALALPGDPTATALLLLDPSTKASPLEAVDVVFPLLHGPYGEDGTVQGLLELAGVPYVGSGVLASAASMDKEYMKLVLDARGLPVGRFALVREREWIADPHGALDRLADLGGSVFVKPARGGSSLGISSAATRDELAAALELAFRHDTKALVEVRMVGREIECGVLEGLDGALPDTSLPAEIHVGAGREFYDFDAKYLGDTTFDVPARLPAEVLAEVRGLSAAAFTALGCEGLARVDFFLDDAGALTVNELNTMPGFTPASMFPRMWAATGLDYPALVDRLIRTALGRRPGLR